MCEGKMMSGNKRTLPSRSSSAGHMRGSRKERSFPAPPFWTHDSIPVAQGKASPFHSLPDSERPVFPLSPTGESECPTLKVASKTSPFAGKTEKNEIQWRYFFQLSFPRTLVGNPVLLQMLVLLTAHCLQLTDKDARFRNRPAVR